ncbi:MAG: glycosyltransferase family 2 protein, partial [Acidobacteriota bacterium]|nr:glycosyltransferase family 2 protein [Acidobacteriota bacterium]
MSPQPLVSIGLPVYNGEKHLSRALSTLLAQDYADFELIISDNNSKDSTAEICREFEARDSRIRYIRQAENHGAPRNFVFVLEQAQGEFFMWAAHDDWWDPSYIGKCLTTLQAHPEAVLACTEVNFVDGEDKPSPYLIGWKNLDTSGMDPVARVHQMIARMGWYAIYGLMRSEAIRSVKSVGRSVFGSDVLILMEFILMGHFVKIPETLFNYRIVKPKSAADFQADFNSEKCRLPPTPVP